MSNELIAALSGPAAMAVILLIMLWKIIPNKERMFDDALKRRDDALCQLGNKMDEMKEAVVKAQNQTTLEIAKLNGRKTD